MVDFNDRRGPSPLYSSMDKIKEKNENAGNNWFQHDSMKFFDSRVGSQVYGGTHFVTSEKHPGDDGGWNRKYSVRAADADGGIHTVGEFGEHATRGAAVRAAKNATAKETVSKHPTDSYVRGSG